MKISAQIFLICAAVAVASGAFMFLHGPHKARPARRAPAIDFDHRPISKPLVDAGSAGDLHKIKSLLDHGVSPNSVVHIDDDEGSSALEAAAADGKFEAVKLLISRGADVNEENFWGGTPLIAASVWGYPEVVDYLIAHGADVNAEDDSVTALAYAEGQLAASKTEERSRFSRVVASAGFY